MALAEGASFSEAGGSLLPEKNAQVAQSEQVAQCLELLLLLLADVTRLREGSFLRLTPWRARIEGLSRSQLPVRPAQDLAFEALRHLTRNPFAESLLKELGLALKTR